MPPGLRFNQPSLSAGGVPLLGAFDLYLPFGALTLLTGPNGAGKSSLLRWVANNSSSEGCNGYFFAGELGLRAELDVFDQASYFAELFSIQHRSDPDPDEYQQEERINQILTRVGLLNWSDEKVGTLSSGQKVRLGLCGLLLSNRHVWLLDEPLNALDTQSVELFASAIADHLNAGGVVLMASHADVGLLMQYQSDIHIHHYHIESGSLTLLEGLTTSDVIGPDSSVSAEKFEVIPPSTWGHFRILLQREWKLVLGNPQSILWSALFHWMILTFFSLSLIKSDLDASRGAIWVSSILAILLLAKDWFSDDQRCGWMGILTQTDMALKNATAEAGVLPAYWLSKVMLSIFIQMASVLPVAFIAAVQFGLDGHQMIDLIFSLALGLAAAAPLLALVSLMVLMTRGGAVLVYVLALPLLVPVMVFGLEGSQAQELGRSTFAPWSVLGSIACLGLLLGPWLGRRLMILIQE